MSEVMVTSKSSQQERRDQKVTPRPQWVPCLLPSDQFSAGEIQTSSPLWLRLTLLWSLQSMPSSPQGGQLRVPSPIRRSSLSLHRFFVFFFFFKYFAMQDPRSLTRDRTQAPCSESEESLPGASQGRPCPAHFLLEQPWVGRAASQGPACCPNRVSWLFFLPSEFTMFLFLSSKVNIKALLLSLA